MNKLSTLSIALAMTLAVNLYLSSTRTATAVGAADAGSKFDIGLVDMERIFSEYYKSSLLNDSVEKTKSTITKEVKEKQESHSTIVASLKGLKKKMDDPTLSVTQRKEHQVSAQAKLDELRMLEADIQEHTARRSRNLLKETQASKSAILDEITQMVKTLAKEKGLDAVFDDSGLSDIGYPFVVHVENPTDLSESVIAKLNARAPKTATPVE